MKTILIDAVDCFVSDTGEINQAMHDMLETFDNPKLIVTTAPVEMIPIFGLDKVPYPVFSLKKDPLKTDPKFWKILLEEKGLNIEDVVYFEHSQDALTSAESTGITCYFYDHEKGDVDGIEQFLKANL